MKGNQRGKYGTAVSARGAMMRGTEVPMADYQRLDVWRKAHELAIDVHRLAARQAGDASAAALCDEMRRAALRIPVLIVHGSEADSAPAFAGAMREAAALVHELAYRFGFARDAGVLDAVPYAKLEARTIQLRAMLGALTRTVQVRIQSRDRAAGARGAESPVQETARAVAQAVRRDRRGVPGADSSPRGSRPRSTS